MMQRAQHVALVLAVCAGLLACATFRDDLDRAANHYQNNEPERALALLEVLEIDIDSLSPAERAQYAYYRGMSHFRLEQRREARHWLGRADARQQKHKDSLSPDELKRVDTTLDELNAEKFGGSSSMPGDPSPKCTSESDCTDGQICDAGACTAPGAGSSADKDPKGDAPKKCSSDTDCPGTMLCSKEGVCAEP